MAKDDLLPCAALIATLRRRQCYVAENGLFRIAEQALSKSDWEEEQRNRHYSGPPRLNLPPVKESTLRRMPESIHFRRIRKCGTGHYGPVPLCKKLFRIVEAYVDLELGFEVNKPLGPHLNRERLRLWREWGEEFDDTGRDPYHGFDPTGEKPETRVALAKLLIRRGLKPSPSPTPERALPGESLSLLMTTGQIVACVARYAFAGPLSHLSPSQAITEEMIPWAESIKTITAAHEERLMRQLTAIWNDCLASVLPTRSDVDLILRIFPPPEGVVRKRIAALRLLCRAKAQMQSWHSDLVEIPTTWFRAEKNPADPRSIVGVSTGTYIKDLMEPLGAAGVLELVDEGSFKLKDRRCSTYRVHRIRLGGERLNLEDAERLLMI